MLQTLFFIFGAIWGSFANVVIFRFNKKSVVFPRSCCQKCQRPIFWYDNIPIISWLALRGRCRFCQQGISFQYPLVELCSGLAALVLYHRFGFSFLSLLFFAVFLILSIVALIDFYHYLIPLIPTFMLIPLSVALSYCEFINWELVNSDQAHYLAFSFWVLPKIIGLCAGFVILAAVLIISTYFARASGRISQQQLAMGWGDPILLACIGALLGWQSLAWVLTLGCLQGIIYYVIAQKIAKTHHQLSANDDDIPEQSLPLGTFMCLAAIEIIIFAPMLYSAF